MFRYYTDILIIGSGPSGYTSSIYTSRAFLKSILISGPTNGGQLTMTLEVENYPGFNNSSGINLMRIMEEQAKNSGVQIINDTIIRVNLLKWPFTFYGESGKIYTSNAAIIATGTKTRFLKVPGEKKFFGRGVSSCAICDGFFYRNKKVIVIGGGDKALEEALHLSFLAKEVTIIHRKNNFRAENIIKRRILSRKNIEVIWNHTIQEIIGIKRNNSSEEFVSGVRIKNVKTLQERTLSVDGIFIAIGYVPCLEFLENQLRKKNNGYLWTKPNSTETNIPGIFAAGDVTDNFPHQAITAAGNGCIAALEAKSFLQGN